MMWYALKRLNLKIKLSNLELLLYLLTCESDCDAEYVCDALLLYEMVLTTPARSNVNSTVSRVIEAFRLSTEPCKIVPASIVIYDIATIVPDYTKKM